MTRPLLLILYLPDSSQPSYPSIPDLVLAWFFAWSLTWFFTWSFTWSLTWSLIRFHLGSSPLVLHLNSWLLALGTPPGSVLVLYLAHVLFLTLVLHLGLRLVLHGCLLMVPCSILVLYWGHAWFAFVIGMCSGSRLVCHQGSLLGTLLGSVLIQYLTHAWFFTGLYLGSSLWFFT